MKMARVSALLLSFFGLLITTTVIIGHRLPVPSHHCSVHIDRHPQAPVIYVKTGDSYAQLGEETPALANYNCAIRIRPQDSALYYNLARLLENRQSPIEIDPNPTFEQVSSNSRGYENTVMLFFNIHTSYKRPAKKCFRISNGQTQI